MPRSMVRLLIAGLVTVAAVAGPSTQEPNYTLKVDVPLVSVDVTVTDSSGKTVSTLAARDFQLMENGIPQQIQYFGPVSAPYNILLLFDRSGSTQYKWAFMQRAVAGFIANLRPQDRIAIDSFDSGFEALAHWSDSRQKTIESLAELIHPKAIGATDFYGAVETAVRREFKNVTGRRAVVVLTDGRDTSFYREILRRNQLIDIAEDKGYQRTLKAVRDARIPVYFVAIDTDRNFEPGSGDEVRKLQMLFPDSPMAQHYLVAVRTRMETIAETSGGKMLYPGRIEDIVPMYQRIGRELGTSYSLGYISSDSRTDGSIRRIEVRVADGTLQLSQSRTTYVAK